MSILGLFSIANSALMASQAALSVTSNNVANVNTPGYSRQEIVLNIATPDTTGQGTIGTGVTVAGVNRSYDQFVQAQLLGQGQNQSRSAALDQAWGQIEQVFNEAQNFGLSSAMADYFNAWNDVASNPESQTPRSVLLQKASALTVTAQGMERSITDTLQNTNAGITDAVKQVNTIAADIAKLNDQIIQQEAGSNRTTANDLRDQRDQKLTELSKLIDFSTYEDNNGSITVTVGMRNLVSGVGTNPLSSARNSDGNQDLYLDGMNVTSNIQRGEIGGLLAARNDIQTTALTGLRKLVASITQQVNLLHRAGFGLDASSGNDFFTPLQLTTTDNSPGADLTATITDPALLTLDEYRITFDSGGNYNVYNKQSGGLVTSGAYVPAGTTIALSGMNVDISGAVTPADSFTVSPIANAVSNFSVAISDPGKVAASSSALELPGNNTNALQLAQLTDSAQSTLGNTSFSSYYNGVVGAVGSMKQTAADGLAFDNNLLSALNTRRDSISGVSLDEEAANLIRFQRSYEAGARMITVADELMQTIINLGSGL